MDRLVYLVCSLIYFTEFKGLQCYIGNSNHSQLMDCPQGQLLGPMKKCAKNWNMADRVVSLNCATKTVEDETRNNKDISKTSSKFYNDCWVKNKPSSVTVEWILCLCDTDGCNSASRYANQAIHIFAVSSLIKIVLN